MHCMIIALPSAAMDSGASVLWLYLLPLVTGWIRLASLWFGAYLVVLLSRMSSHGNFVNMYIWTSRGRTGWNSSWYRSLTAHSSEPLLNTDMYCIVSVSVKVVVHLFTREGEKSAGING